jgi:hypothetical protein
MKKGVAAVVIAVALAMTPASAHRSGRIDYFRVASKNVTQFSVQGYFHVSHRVNRHTNDGNEFTTETWCDIYIRAKLLRNGRTVSREDVVAFGASNKGRERAYYYLSRKGYNLPPNRRAKRVVVRHVHVDRASCQAF